MRQRESTREKESSFVSKWTTHARGSDNIEERLNKDRINIIVRKILAHLDYTPESNKQYSFTK